MRFTVAAFLYVVILATNGSVAQSRVPMNAFTNCMSADGSSYLCSMNAWVLAEGYSATAQALPATLDKKVFSNDSAQEACELAVAPRSYEIHLPDTNPRQGDRIYLSDIIIEAYDENDYFLPDIPVLVIMLSQSGMLISESHLDYIEVANFGYATLMVQFYCGTIRDVAGNLTITVDP